MPTKFYISISAHYEDMKKDTNLENGVVWGGYGSLKVTQNSVIR